MSDLPQIAEFIEAIVLPLIGGFMLLLAKFSEGDAARRAERQFFAVLLVFTLLTLRTVIMCHDYWLVHTATLATMIVGALVIPSQEDSIAV